jgi:hypothetical protein
MADIHPAGPQPGHGKDNLIPGVKYVIAVSSGKGGVGKSTVSVNLAVALALTGAKVGLLDADIYGPNIPMMMGVTKPPEQKDGKIAPAESHGVKLISMGFFVPEDTAVVWRGPMVHTAIQQLFRDVLWGELLAHRSAPWNRRRAAHPHPIGPADRRRHRYDTTRSRVARCPQRHDDVPKGECTAPRYCGEHELLSLRPLRRADRNIFVRRRGAGCRHTRGSVSRSSADRPGHSRRRRLGYPDRRSGSGISPIGGVPGDRTENCRRSHRRRKGSSSDRKPAEQN